MLADSPLISLVPTAPPEAAHSFYRDTLGLRFVADGCAALVFDAGGSMLRITRVDAVPPARFTAVGWRLSGIREAVAGLRAGRPVSRVRRPGAG